MSEYIGMRIIPRHDGKWDVNKTYEPLVIVIDESGDSYMSRKTVPAGTELSNENYWAFCQSFSGQVKLAEERMDAAVEGMRQENQAALNTVNQTCENTVAAVNKKADETVAAVNQKTDETVAAVSQTCGDTVDAVTEKTDAAIRDTQDTKNSLVSRMDAIEKRQESNVTASTDKNADYAAEVVDARTGFDGRAFSSLGEAVRTQAGLADRLNALNDIGGLSWFRLINARSDNGNYDVTQGTYYDKDGEQVSYQDGKWSVLLIPCSYGDWFHGNGEKLTIFVLDKDKKQLGTFYKDYRVLDPMVRYIGISVLTEAGDVASAVLTNMVTFDFSAHADAKKEICYVDIDGEDISLDGMLKGILAGDRFMDILPLYYYKRFDLTKYEMVAGYYNSAGELVPVNVGGQDYGSVLIPCEEGKHYYCSGKRSGYFISADRKLIRGFNGKNYDGYAPAGSAYFTPLVYLDREDSLVAAVSNIPDFDAASYQGCDTEKYLFAFEDGKCLKLDSSALTSDDTVLPDGTDLDDVTENRFCLLNEGYTYGNKPVASIGYLMAQHVGKFVQQLYFVYGGTKVYRRIKQHDGVWSAWAEVTKELELPGGIHVSDTDILADGTDLDSVTGNRFCLLESSYSYGNTPASGAAFLSAYTAGGFTLQTFYSYTGAKAYKRRRDKSGSWEGWKEVFSGDYVTNNNTFTTNVAQNTYNVTAAPTITTDTNNFLASTGDTTDVTAEIAAVLATGCCKLGPGVFYVSNLTMPDNSVLEGSGGTQLILSADVTDGYAVKLGNYCRIRNLTILGGTTDISVTSETVGTRHGIMFSGTYNSDNGSTLYCQVEGVRIARFTGGGITLYNTGYSARANMEVSNAIIMNCGAGINISYWSEYSHFTNVECQGCYYGCINNGGNNVFTNCSFTEDKVGMLFDNSLGDKPNNSHGSVIGCLFNHSGSNEGVGIKLVNIANGEVFSGCQLFYSDIVIEKATNIIFSNFVCGRNVDISITEGQTVLFDTCVFNPAPDITVKDSNNVRFLNCYDQGGNTVSA